MKNKLTKNPIFWLFQTFLVLFIFTTINREFLFLGLDLRFPTVILGITLLFVRLVHKPVIDKDETKNPKKVFLSLLLFFSWCFISNISWLWNGLEINQAQFLNQNILLFSNFLALIVVYLYRSLVDKNTINKLMIFSCLVLVFSFAMTLFGFNLAEISGSSNARSISVTTSRGEFRNVYGGDFRLAGYAEDANYASVFLALAVVATVQLKKRRFLKLVLGVIFLIALGYASSRTVFFSLVIGLVYQFIFMALKNREKPKKLLNLVFIGVLPLTMILLPRLGILNELSTMSTRYGLWGIAEQTFIKSPIIGNGISSARSAINAEHPGWYVQPHSNYWQLLAETGLVGLILFMIAMYRCLGYDKNNKYSALPIIILIVFGLTFEIIQLQIFVFVAFLNLIGRDDDEKRLIYS